MKISAKGHYGLAAMISMAQESGGGCTAIISIAQKLGISKIYLEQVFSLLKRAKLVNSVKGAGGGYQLSRPPEKISAYEILSAVELPLFEKAKPLIPSDPGGIEAAMKNLVFEKLDESVEGTLKAVTLADLVGEAQKHAPGDSLMFYI